MKEQYINVRFESMNNNKIINEIKHELRSVKISSVKNVNDNYLFLDGKITKFKMGDKNNKIISKKFIDNIPNIENKHRKLLRKNFNQSLNKKRVNSLNSGVLTFSDNINNQDMDQVFDIGIKTINEICKKLDVKLYYITLHMDEKGLPHFHYLTDNFDSQGKTINPKRNKDMGSMLQDMGAKYFSELGFKRGISKSISGKKHLSIQEYQDYQDTKKELQEMKEQQETLLNGFLPLLDTFLELGMNYKNKSPEEVIMLFQRYVKGDKIDKLIKVMEKISIISKLSQLEMVKFSNVIEQFKELQKSQSKDQNNSRKLR